MNTVVKTHIGSYGIIIKDEKIKVLNLEKENDLLNKIADVIKDVIKK